MRVGGIVSGVVALFFGGCSIVSSYNTSLLEDGGNPRNGAGAYHLPKHVIVATVTQVGKNKPEIHLIRKAIADPDYPMNLGLNLSPTSDDDITIDYSEGLIQKITAKADDKTKDIILNFTKAVLTPGRVGGAHLAGDLDAQRRRLIRVEFDPFNQIELHRSNDELRRFGFCIAFAPDRRIPHPTGCRWRAEVDTPHYEGRRLRPTSRAASGEGLFFRQPIEHKLQVFTQHGRDCRKWCLEWEGYESFANAGPLLKANVNRTLLVKHETTITFGSDGVPSQVIVKKPSEGLALSLLAVEMGKIIISAPTAAIANSVSTLQEEKKLVDARADLVKSQSEYIDSLNEHLKKGSELPPGTDVGAVLGTTPVRLAADGGGGYGAPQRSAQAERAIQDRNAFQQYCIDIGLDRGGCDGEWRRINNS